MDLSEILAGVVHDAIALDLERIQVTIIATHDRWPGGTRSSETGIRATRMEHCSDPSCSEWPARHDHPIPNDPTGDAAMRPSESDRDLTLLDQHAHRFVAAIANLTRRAHSRRPPADWAEALTDANLLAETGMLDDLERLDHRDTKRWVLAAGDAVHDLGVLASRHVSREPNDWERSWTSGLADEQCCRVCLQLRLRVVRHARGLCQACWKLSQASRERTVDGGAVDPPPELIENLRRTNMAGPAWVKERQAWLDDLGRRHRTNA